MKYPCSRLVAVLCAGFVSFACFGQNAPTFTSAVSPNGPTPFHVYAIDVNNDGLTDIVQSGIIPNANTKGFYGACSCPSSGESIHLCSPPASAAAGGPVVFAALANAFGQLRKMELQVDGAKLGEERWVWGHSSYFNLTDSRLSLGTHDGTIYAADIDSTLQRDDFTFTVGTIDERNQFPLLRRACGAKSEPSLIRRL